jgi:single-strand DNA-binding protein
MAQNINRVVIEGNLTKDPEVRQTPSGTSVATLRVAVNDRIKRGEEWVDAAYYFDVVVWGRTAEQCGQFLNRGSGIMVDGKLTWREYEAKDGSGKRQVVEIKADNVRFGARSTDGGGGGGRGGDGGGYSGGGGGGGGGGATYVPPASSEPDFGGSGPDDDIPF